MGRRLSVLRDAINVVIRRLAGLPPSPEVEDLRVRAEDYLQQTHGWSRSPPPPEERDRVSKRVLTLHVAVAKLERQGPALWNTAVDADRAVGLLHLGAEMPHAPACPVCGHPIFDAKRHDIRARRAADMFPTMTCKCGKPARVRCYNVVGTYWVECEEGHGMGRPA